MAENDDFMMELFRTEVEGHTASLNEGLLALEGDPTDAKLLESLMRAAHSIKGAARIVGLDPAVKLAHEMEALLVAAQEAKVVLDSEQIDALLLGTDFFQRLGQAQPAEMQTWLYEHQDETTGLLANLAAYVKGEKPTAKLAAPKAAPEPEPKGVELPVSESLPKGAKAPAPTEPEPPPLDLDPELVELFRSEAEGRVTTLREGIRAVSEDQSSKEVLESLMRAAHSLKGSAQIVGLDVCAKLAKEMEYAFQDAMDGKLKLSSQLLKLLSRGTDLIGGLTASGAEGVPVWLAKHQGDFAAAASEISVAMKGGGPAKKKGKKAAAPAASNAEPAQVDLPSEVSAVHPAVLGKPPSSASGQGITVDPYMLDLFRTEVEGHAASLNEKLLALEGDPTDAKSLEALMRAAHSIKGAGRIIGLDDSVKLAHVMEDCFVAAQEGKLVFEPSGIDLMLQGADMFVRMAQNQAPELPNWLVAHRGELTALANQIGQFKIHGKVPGAKPVAAPAPPKVELVQLPVTPSGIAQALNAGGASMISPGAMTMPAGAGTPANNNASMGGGGGTKRATSAHSGSDSGRAVRVSADNLNRLLGLAGESLVETRWHGRFVESMLAIKRNQARLSSTLRMLRNVLDGPEMTDRIETVLSEAERRLSECRQTLVERLNEFERFAHRADTLAQRLYRETVASRMRPFDDGVQGFPRLVRDLGRQLGKKVKFEIEGRNTEVDRDILEKLEAPLNHIIRNAMDHGLETPEDREAKGKNATGTIKLEARHRAGMLLVTVTDDGRGVDMERLKKKIVEKKLSTEDLVSQMKEQELLEFLFLPGFSTAAKVTDVSGRGVGLDVVQNMIQISGGIVRIINKHPNGCVFQLQLPITLSVIRALLVEINGEPYAFPLSRIERLVTTEMSKIVTLEDRQYLPLEGENVGLVSAWQALSLKEGRASTAGLPVVVINDRNNRYGLVVEQFLGECELVVRRLDTRLGKVPAISAASILEDGSPVLIVDVEDLVRTTDNLLNERRLQKVGAGETSHVVKGKKRILVVDDSFTVRETERKLLERHGYEVKTAVDGMDGWNAIRTGKYDLVISDVDMPRMNGIELVRNIKKDDRLKVVPVMVVSYKDRDEDRQKGLDAGANCYLTKGSFHDDSMIQTVRDLIGEGHA